MDILVHFFPIIPLLIASYIDLLKKEVPDVLNYTSFVCFFLILLFLSLISKINILNSLISLVILLSISLLFVQFNFWGGGDLKVLLWLSLFINRSPLDGVLFIFLILASGIVYNFIYSLAIYLQEKLYKKYNLAEIVKEYKLVMLLLIVLSIIISLINVYLGILAGVLLILSFIISNTLDKFFTKKIPVNRLVEGDWIVESVKVKGIEIPKKTIHKEELYIGILIAILSTILYYVVHSQILLISIILSLASIGIALFPRASYLTSEDIKLLKQFGVKEVTIKEGIPFVPAITMAYIVYLVLISQNISILDLFSLLRWI